MGRCSVEIGFVGPLTVFVVIFGVFAAAADGSRSSRSKNKAYKTLQCNFSLFIAQAAYRPSNPPQPTFSLTACRTLQDGASHTNQEPPAAGTTRSGCRTLWFWGFTSAGGCGPFGGSGGILQGRGGPGRSTGPTDSTASRPLINKGATDSLVDLDDDRVLLDGSDAKVGTGPPI